MIQRIIFVFCRFSAVLPSHVVPQILTRAETPKTFKLSRKVSDSYNHAEGVATAFMELLGHNPAIEKSARPA
jgi:hypothetical protein